MLSAYTEERADALSKMRIPEMDSSVGCRILWAELLTDQSIRHRIRLDGHSHSFYEVHFVFSGSITYACNGAQKEICAGEALLILPEVEHGFLGCRGDLQRLSVAFSFDRDLLAEQRSRGTDCICFSFPREIAEHTDSILIQSEKQHVFSPVIVGGRILEMICLALGALEMRIPEIDGQDLDPRALVARDYIERNRFRAISREEVAKECCISSKQLDRIFKPCVGMSVFEYVNHVRIREAKRLLLQSGYSIKEITYHMGFENESSFVSFFKRHCGVSPGKLRQLYNE